LIDRETYRAPDVGIFEVIEDPGVRWRKKVETYSGLKLTYESNRLPAIAAIVERELIVRQYDTYIAGMWTSSLLRDLHWAADPFTSDPFASIGPCLPRSAPTWAWSSSQERVYWYDGVMLPALRLLGLSFSAVGPTHVGEVKDASIT
jgi:hypothetical protein